MGRYFLPVLDFMALGDPKRTTPGVGLLLPGALLMTMRAQLLAALMLINFRFPTFF